MSVLLRGGMLLPMTEGAAARRGDLLISGARIAAIGAVDAPRDATVADISGCYVLPGLVQTHLHLVQTLFRGLAEDLDLLAWLRRRIWPLEASLDEGSVRASVRLGALELLRTGTTTVLDMGTSHSGDVVAEELVRSGLRARFGQAMMDAGEGVPARLLETTRGSLDASAALAKRWHGASGGRIGYAYSPRFALSCTRELLEAAAAVARIAGHLVHTHSNESAEERALVEAATKRSPIAYLAEVGIACERAIVAHGVHVDAEERALLASTGTSVAHCPSSNLKLGSGIADVPALRRARITVGIGADGAACNNSLDLFEEMRLATLIARNVVRPAASGGAQGALTAADALLMATRDGARALGLGGEIGSLEAGKRADLVVLDAAMLAGPGGDAATRIVFGGGSRAVRHVYVDGEALVVDGRPTRYDEAEVRARAAEALPPLMSRAAL